MKGYLIVINKYLKVCEYENFSGRLIIMVIEL